MGSTLREIVYLFEFVSGLYSYFRSYLVSFQEIEDLVSQESEKRFRRLTKNLLFSQRYGYGRSPLKEIQIQETLQVLLTGSLEIPEKYLKEVGEGLLPVIQSRRLEESQRSLTDFIKSRLQS